MQQKDFDQFKSLMLGLAENYGQSLTGPGIALRFKALAEFEIMDIERASYSVMASRKYTTMPTVADFLEHLGGGSAEDKGEVEAGKVTAAMRSWGRYASVVFDDAVTQAVIMNVFGGWPSICDVVTDKWFRQEFIKAYAAYSRQNQKQFGHLPGLTELDNKAKGLNKYVPAPTLVGNPQKAKQVMLPQAENQNMGQNILMLNNLVNDLAQKKAIGG